MTEHELPTPGRKAPQKTAAPGRASAGAAERWPHDRRGLWTGPTGGPMTGIETTDERAPIKLALSKVDAANALGVSVDFFEDHVMSDLRIVRRGRRRLIPIGELHRWLETNAHRTLER